jgi:nucleotide-binding universal stress UspA family protein
MLSGAVNTAIVGSNGVMNRVAEDGVLPGWFRQPHHKFGTTYRIIGFIGVLQITTIVLSRGDVQLLGDAYAFGVVWSFTAMSLSMLVLRFKRPGEREWRVPWNLRLGRTEVPVGLGLIFLTLFSLAIVNLFTKKIATIWGFGFTAAIFVMFELTERANRKRETSHDHTLERFLLGEEANVRPGGVLVAVRNPASLDHLQRVLAKTDAKRMDIVVLTIQQDLEADHPFNTDVAALFSQVVSMAERAGKHVELMVVSSEDPDAAIVEIASRLKSSLVVMGGSPKMTPDEQARRFGDKWERLPAPRPQLSLRIGEQYFNLGPHPPRLWPEDLDLLHRLWLEMTQRKEGQKLHHRDVVHIALRRLERDFNGAEGDEIIRELKP